MHKKFTENSFEELYLSSSESEVEYKVGDLINDEMRKREKEINNMLHLSRVERENMKLKEGIPTCHELCKGCVDCQGIRWDERQKKLENQLKEIEKLEKSSGGPMRKHNRTKPIKNNPGPVRKSKNFMVTVWDTSIEMQKRIIAFEHNKKITRFVCQEEICPTTEKHHYQCYITLNNMYRTQWVHDLFGGDPPCGVKFADGNHPECFKYCTKEESRVKGGFSFVKGTFESKKPGRR